MLIFCYEFFRFASIAKQIIRQKSRNPSSYWKDLTWEKIDQGMF